MLNLLSSTTKPPFNELSPERKKLSEEDNFGVKLSINGEKSKLLSPNPIPHTIGNPKKGTK